MPVKGEVFRHLVVARGEVAGPVVLGSVDDAGLESAVDLTEGHGGRYGTESRDQAHHELAFLDPYLQSLEVSHGFDFSPGVVEVPGLAILLRLFLLALLFAPGVPGAFTSPAFLTSFLGSFFLGLLN